MDDEALTIETDSTTNSQSALLYVELYLVILAFFILLNAISDEDESRKVDVLQSIQNHFFNYDLNIEDIGVEYDWPTGTSYLPSEFVIQHHSITPLEHLDFLKDGNVMVTHKDIGQFFEPNSAKLQASYIEWLNELARILHEDSRELNFTVDIMIGSPTLLTNDKTFDNQTKINVKRISTITEHLIKHNVLPQNMRIGITQDHPNKIAFKLLFKSETTL